jgi:hypothetical protein
MTASAPALRPLGIGDIIDAVFSLVRARPLVFVVAAALPQLVYTIVGRALGVVQTTSIDEITALLEPPAVTPRPVVTPDELLQLSGIGVLFLVVATVIFSVQSGALVEAAARRYLGEDVTLREALGRALGEAPRLIATALLAIGAILVLVAAITTIGLVGAFLAALVYGAAAILLVVLTLVAVVVALSFVGASWIVAPVAVMREGAGPIRALSRSWWLARGSRWRILALTALLLVLQVVFAGLFSFVFLVSFAAEPTARTLLQEAANLLTAAVLAPLQWGSFTVLYYDLRVRREGYDLRLAAEALSREG